MKAWPDVRRALLAATLIASLGCDIAVQGRVKVVTNEDEAIPDALVDAGNFAAYTDADGCTYLSGVIHSNHKVLATASRTGYQSKDFEIPLGENCFLVHLAPAGQGTGSVETLAPQACPCAVESGYKPTMSARFKVTAADGTPVERVAARAADEPLHEWAQVTDPKGCLGINWIVPPHQRGASLLLEKDGYRAARVEVPTMKKRCYAVRLARADEARSSTVVPISEDQCECEELAGKTIWRN
jgi:hypothetical protein